MIFRLLVLFGHLICFSVFASGRSPAVEDFVGIEIEQARVAPSGNEVLFNLEKDVAKIESQKNPPMRPIIKMRKTDSRDWEVTTFLGFAVLLVFPLSVWFLIMSYFKKKASQENASNIEVLEKYRREKETKRRGDIRKVS
jgi:hypothetical protein